LKKVETNTIFTIGHSTHPIEKFIEMLKSFDIKLLADIRTFPASRRFPHFNAEQLNSSLANSGISYQHFPALGGRRKPRPGSVNGAWRVTGFRGYADYMETEVFKTAAKELAKLARTTITVYMCSEAVWWSCHRSLLSDYYKSTGWNVLHIMSAGKTEVHPYTKPARIVSGKLTYAAQELFPGGA
jgi:uncharacterized protein (DUF488 family)